MRRVVIFFVLLGSACGGSRIIIPTELECAAPILTQNQIDEVRMEFPKFIPEKYCSEANPANPSTLTTDNYVPARFYGTARTSAAKTTPLGIRYISNQFDQADIAKSLPPIIYYFDVSGNRFSLELPEDPQQRPLRVTPQEIDELFLATRNDLAAEFPEVMNVSPTNFTVTFEHSVFFVENSLDAGDTWAGGVVDSSGKDIRVAIFELSPRRKVPISWRGIAGHSVGWLRSEFKKALLKQSD